MDDMFDILGISIFASGSDLKPVFFQKNMEHEKMFVFFMLKG